MSSTIPHLVGMVHLQPLPGAPGFSGSIDEAIAGAVADAVVLAEAGFPALMIENFGDVPFTSDHVAAETTASITRAVMAIGAATKLPIGVNVLRNDALAALGIAAATNAEFIRVNVLTGVMYTDQGPIVGRAAELARKRSAIAPWVEIWADVMVKHATPPAGQETGQAAADTVERGLADAVIVSGPGTGSAPQFGEAELVRNAVPKETRLVIGSGATAANLASLAQVADSFIVGTSIKRDGRTAGPVDPDKARQLVGVARDCGIT